MRRVWLIFLFGWVSLYATSERTLFDDLRLVSQVNQEVYDYMPLIYNNLLQGGYINMPSARMPHEGIIGCGFSYIHPYRIYSLHSQLLRHVEISGNYRVFSGIKDPLLSPRGFGDFSDKGANIKIAIVHPEDSAYCLPGVAIGFEDFIGTRNFNGQYIVATQVFPTYNLEMSVGFGSKRIHRWFGGIAWMPFRQWDHSYLKGLTLLAEYDAIPYKDEKREPHPKGRSRRSHINFGAQYHLADKLQLGVNYVRGEKVAATLSTHYNLGETNGFIPKIQDPLLYRACPCPDMEQEKWIQAFSEQGLHLQEVWVEEGEKALRLTVFNMRYRQECVLRERLTFLLGSLIPERFVKVHVVIQAEGFPVQEYSFCMEYVRSTMACAMGMPELTLLTSTREVTFSTCWTGYRSFYNRRRCWDWYVLPKTLTFFGSSRGKFKYALGVNVGAEGFLPKDIFFSLKLGKLIVSDLHDVNDVDILNPSQVINVHTDIVRYLKQDAITLDQGYLQKNWNMGRGWYAKLAGGYFEQTYGGVATEVLHYPVIGRLAWGVEGAVVQKRTTRGLGFTDRVRKLEGFRPTYRHFLGTQFFFNLYYDWQEAQIDFRVKAGKFLANDYGARFEVARYFPSGMRLMFWYTPTNGGDRVNGKTYHDKGFYFSMPLDVFYTCSSRKRWGYGMAAWLRDVGYSAPNGKELYQLITDFRWSN